MTAPASENAAPLTRQRGSSAVGWIVVGRHGRPALSRDVRITAPQFRDWWRQYDAGGLAEGQTPPPALLQVAAAADLVLASTLQRSIETAQAVAGDKNVLQDPVFVEAALPPPPVFGRRSPSEWGVWARCAWWFGVSGGEESRRAAEQRAEQAARRLIGEAEQGRNVLLCAHGWFNRMMRPVLLREGWRCAVDGGDDYWSFRRYERLR